jgi:hypothetical protein
MMRIFVHTTSVIQWTHIVYDYVGARKQIIGKEIVRNKRKKKSRKLNVKNQNELNSIN